MNKSRIEKDQDSVMEHFLPREHAILAEYFKQPKKLPEEAKLFDPYEIFSNDSTFDEEANGIICRSSTETDDLQKALANAVARIALSPIRSKLPKWASVRNSEVYHTRQEDIESKLPARGFRSQPILALTLNWADSGPGHSWPLDYYVTGSPLYEHYVVTVSYDDVVVEGYLDLAIGTLPERARVEVEMKKVIQDHWKKTAEYLHGWQECWNKGIVKDPWAWRNEIVWAISDEELER